MTRVTTAAPLEESPLAQDPPEDGAVCAERLLGSTEGWPVAFVSDSVRQLGYAPAEFYATTGFPKKEAGEVPVYMTYLDSDKIAPLENLSEDLTLAARNALIEMIDYMVREHDLTREQAYVLASVAVDLHVGQVVDVPNYVMTAILDLGVFEE